MGEDSLACSQARPGNSDRDLINGGSAGTEEQKSMAATSNDDSVAAGFEPFQIRLFLGESHRRPLLGSHWVHATQTELT